MIKPPYTKWINDIKTKLGFNRTMTASGADVVDAVNKQAQQIGDLDDLDTTVKTDLVSAVNSLIPVSVPLTHFVPSYPSNMIEHDGGCFYAVYGNIVYIRFSFKITGTRTANAAISFAHNIPNQYAPTMSVSLICSDGTESGIQSMNIKSRIFDTYHKKASGTEYWIGTCVYMI